MTEEEKNAIAVDLVDEKERRKRSAVVETTPEGDEIDDETFCAALLGVIVALAPHLVEVVEVDESESIDELIGKRGVH